MRVLHIQGFGPLDPGRKIIEKSERSSKEIYEEYTKRGVLYPNCFNKELEKIGYECDPFLIDEPLFLLSLSRELKVPSRDPKALLEEYIKEKSPTIIFLQRYVIQEFAPGFWKEIRRKFPCIQLIAGFHGAQIDELSILKFFVDLDHCFCINPHIQSQIGEVCKSTSLLPPFIEDIPDHIKNFDEREHEIVFAGHSGYGLIDHQFRFLVLCNLAKKLPLKLYLQESSPSFFKRFYAKEFVAKILSCFPKTLFEKAHKRFGHHYESLWNQAEQMRDQCYKRPAFLSYSPIRKMFPDICYDPLYGSEYFSLLSNTQIALNIHVDQKENGSNQRCFEATGMGALLLTDKAQQMEHLFVDEKEIVGFTSAEDAEEKAKWLLNNPAKAKEIAFAGRKKTLTEHSISRRVLEVDQVFQSLLEKKSGKS